MAIFGVSDGGVYQFKYEVRYMNGKQEVKHDSYPIQGGVGLVDGLMQWIGESLQIGDEVRVLEVKKTGSTWD